MRNPSWLVPLVMVAASGVSAQDSIMVAVAEEDELFAPTEHRARADWVENHVARIDSLIEADGPSLSFARLGNQLQETDVIQEVRPGGPAGGATTRFDVFMSEAGVVAVTETPTAYEGDWNNYTVHYFDDRGRTVAVYRYSSFDVGCGFRSWVESRPTSGLEQSLYIFDATGALIAKTYSISTKEGANVDPDTCAFEYRFPYGMLRTWTAFQAANGFEAVARNR